MNACCRIRQTPDTPFANMAVDSGNHRQFETNGFSPDAHEGHETLLFLRTFIRHPSMVGWAFPSSRFLVNEVLKQVDWKKARVIVEYGPGVGSFTRQVLRRMRSDSQLVAVELNAAFYSYLNGSLRDHRLHLVNDSATKIDQVLGHLGLSQADYVISGIPFSTMPHHIRRVIVRKTHALLKPEGGFLVYQFTGAALPYLEQAFGRVSRDFQLLNILPARLFYCAR